jgi:hypothetical protein
VSRDRDNEDELPPTEEEVAASKRLRDALEDPSIDDADADLARSLRAAFSPAALDEGAHAQLLDDVPLSAEEIALAEELRDGLDADPAVQALASAWRPKEINSIEHRQIVAKVLPPAAKRAESGRVVRVTFGFVAGAIAIAASVVVWMNAPHGNGEVPLARARSTQPLFQSYEGFKSGDGTGADVNASARIDKIAVARAGDFRDNRFAKWGVR